MNASGTSSSNQNSNAASSPVQSRFKSWALWAGLLGSVWLITSALGLPQKIGLTDSTFNTIVNAVGSILTLLGVVNNPTNPNGI